MANYDENGNWVAKPIEKGVSKKKKSSGPSDKIVKPKAAPKDVETVKAEVESVKERNNRNRQFGKSVERTVAKLVDGERVPASGAIKTSTWGLVGDVQAKFPDSNRVMLLVECKGTSGITPSGDKTFSLKKSVLDQAVKEGKSIGAISAIWVHWKNANYETDDYVLLSSADFLLLLNAARKDLNGSW